MITRVQMDDAVEFWGLVVLGSAAVFELILIVQRRLAAKYGWERWPTISMVFRDDGKQWLIFPFGWGLLGGHWWGPFPQFFDTDWVIWVVVAGLILWRDIENRFHPRPVSKRVTFEVLVGGVFCGALFWSSGQ